jgi:hypothetical protein
VFVSPAEHYGLENFGNLWRVAIAGIQTFQRNENRCKLLAMWNRCYPNPGSPRVMGYSQVLPVCIVTLLAHEHTFRNDKRECGGKDGSDKRVAPHRWFIGVTLPKIKGRALSLE